MLIHEGLKQHNICRSNLSPFKYEGNCKQETNVQCWLNSFYERNNLIICCIIVEILILWLFDKYVAFFIKINTNNDILFLNVVLLGKADSFLSF